MIKIVLLSASRGAGKTTACGKFVAQAQHMGLRVGGVLTPSCYDIQGRKVGIDALDAHLGERRVFAVFEPDPERATVGQYRMDDSTMQWAVQRITVALQAPIDAVIIDEIGPLELVKKGGLWPTLGQLEEAQATAAVVVVRPELLGRLQELLAPFEPATVALTLSNRDEIPTRILEEIWGPATRQSG